MENLEKIWYKLDDLEKAIAKLMKSNMLEENINQLKQETIISEKWKSWTFTYILGLMTFMTWFTEAFNSIVSMTGIGLITLGGCLMVYFFYKNTIPSTVFEEDTSLDTLKIKIREQLKKRMNHWAFGLAIFMVCLTLGLHLMIFGFDSLAGKGGMVGMFYGAMCGLTGYSVGLIYQVHGLRYTAILKENNLFSNLKQC